MAKIFTRDSSGLAAILKSPEMASVVNSAARKVADHAAASSGLPVEVTPGVTDRVTASVTIAHLAGAPSQAKHGTLTKAAGAAGLELGR